MAQHPDDELPEPRQLRRLRWLVTGLTAVLIVGVLTIAATIVIRLGFGFGFGEVFSVAPIRADRFALPPGAEIVAVGRGPQTVLFVLRGTDGSEALHVFDSATGAPHSRSAIVREGG